MNKAQQVYENVGAYLSNLDEEQLKELWSFREEIGTLDWMLSADIVAELLKKKVGPDGKATEAMIEDLAKFLTTKHRRIRELAQIHKNILTVAPELRKTPLKRSHYVIALRAKEPVGMLRKCLDNNWGIPELRDAIKRGVGVQKTFEPHFYELKEIPSVPAGTVQTFMLLGSKARIIQDGIGNKFLEVKVYEEE